MCFADALVHVCVNAALIPDLGGLGEKPLPLFQTHFSSSLCAPASLLLPPAPLLPPADRTAEPGLPGHCLHPGDTPSAGLWGQETGVRALAACISEPLSTRGREAAPALNALKNWTAGLPQALSIPKQTEGWQVGETKESTKQTGELESGEVSPIPRCCTNHRSSPRCLVGGAGSGAGAHLISAERGPEAGGSGMRLRETCSLLFSAAPAAVRWLLGSCWLLETNRGAEERELDLDVSDGKALAAAAPWGPCGLGPGWAERNLLSQSSPPFPDPGCTCVLKRPHGPSLLQG